MVPPDMADYIDSIERGFAEMMVHEDTELWCEPGRALVAEASSILTKVELTKGDPVAEFAKDVATGLTAEPKYLSCRYFYNQEGSRLFTAICELPEFADDPKLSNERTLEAIHMAWYDEWKDEYGE